MSEINNVTAEIFVTLILFNSIPNIKAETWKSVPKDY